MVALMTTIRSHRAIPDPPISVADTRDKIHEHYKIIDGIFTNVATMLCGPFKDSPEVITETVTIKGIDNNDIHLYNHTPNHVSGPIPCVYFVHGGGMGVFSSTNDYYAAIRTRIALTGVAVIGVEFRNSTGTFGAHPFPAGLNDCMSGLQWVYDNKVARNYSKVNHQVGVGYH